MYCVWKGHLLAQTYWGYTLTQNKRQTNILFNSTTSEHEMLNKYTNEYDEHNDRTTHSLTIYPVSTAITSNNSAQATKVPTLQFHTALSMFNTNNFAMHSTSTMICLKCKLFLPTECKDNLEAAIPNKMSRICGWGGGTWDWQSYLALFHTSDSIYHVHIKCHLTSWLYQTIHLAHPQVISQGYSAVHLCDSVKLCGQATSIHIKICLKKKKRMLCYFYCLHWVHNNWETVCLLFT
jgi:hypothetical protein